MDLTKWSYRNQIDYILCSQRWRSSILSAKTRPGAECGSDHELLIAKFRLKLRKVGKTTRPFRYDLNQIPYDYTVEVTNRFKGLDMIECLKNYGVMQFVMTFASPGFPDSLVGKESACNSGDPSSIPESGRPAGEGIGYPLQYSWASLVTQLMNRLQCGRHGFNPSAGKITWRRQRPPPPVFWPENSLGCIVYAVAKSWK